MRQNLKLTLGDGDAAPILVKPGGTLTGRLLKPDGSPIVGEKVQINSATIEEAVTDAQGRFTIEGLEPGEEPLFIGDFFDTEKATALPEYILERYRNVRIEAGKTTEVGEIKAQKGLTVEARVVGADTKAPLPDAKFRIGYNNVVNIVGDDGTLRTRVVPSEERRTVLIAPKSKAKVILTTNCRWRR